jgi:hypothetical protein
MQEIQENQDTNSTEKEWSVRAGCLGMVGALIGFILFVLVAVFVVDRFNLGQDKVLVGTWHWEEDCDYIYVFDANGNGTRENLEHYEDFVWKAAFNILTLNIFHDYGLSAETWTYTVVGDTLTLNKQFSEQEYRYILAR